MICVQYQEPQRTIFLSQTMTTFLWNLHRFQTTFGLLAITTKQLGKLYALPQELATPTDKKCSRQTARCCQVQNCTWRRTTLLVRNTHPLGEPGKTRKWSRYLAFLKIMVRKSNRIYHNPVIMSITPGIAILHFFLYFVAAWHSQQPYISISRLLGLPTAISTNVGT